VEKILSGTQNFVAPVFPAFRDRRVRPAILRFSQCIPFQGAFFTLV
jgi:hypothetical protein